jgi:hypothetical protein
MTSLEFRRSLLLLVDQVEKNHTTIQNYNAWLKAAFFKNEGPLVTQRMIEAHLDHLTQVPRLPQNQSVQKTVDDHVRGDFDALRRYLAASPDDRLAIDKITEEKMALAFRITPLDKHPEIREQALIEAAHEFFAKKS